MRPIVARISLDALANNLRVARQHAGQSRIIAVVKANAYGHGLTRALRALASSDGFGVLTVDEAANLRQMGVDKPILLLEGFFQASELPAIVELGLTPVLHSPEQLTLLSRQPFSAPVNVFVKFNSGMNRLGFPLERFDQVIGQVKALKNVQSITLITHFATADDKRGAAWQAELFLAKVGGAGLPLTMANSAALLRYPQFNYDWVRPGIMLYGASPFADASAESLGLKPAMTLQSEVIAVQHLKAGEGLGYGLSWQADKPTRVGVVACGYGDGYPRHAPSGTPLGVNGKRSRTLGRVSMDMLYVDLSELPDSGVGSAVTLWGEVLPVEDVARSAGTISYELLCALAPRVPVVET
ncbi:MAG: alanine racemase [Thiobacillaceae bacterium]